IEESGTVAGLFEENDLALQSAKIEFYDGVLIPGLVNAHCHIELSHMLGKVERGGGLPKFLTQVMKDRAFSEQQILSEIEIADKTMFANGIQAVGDHVNTRLSSEVKANSPIHYHT